VGYPVLATRQWVSERIAARVADSRSAGVLAALVVGDQSAIEMETDIKVGYWRPL
jgi:competence protein ComEC